MHDELLKYYHESIIGVNLELYFINIEVTFFDKGRNSGEEVRLKKFDNYIIEKLCDSNSDKLQKILIIESLVDDILQFSLRINNSVGEIFLLQPFQKKTIFIPCYFEEDIVKVKDDDKVEWNLLEFQKFRAFLA